MNKKDLSERDICTKFITPAIVRSAWKQHQFREEVQLTKGRVIVRGTLAYRLQNPEAKGGPKRADYILYGPGNLVLAVIEAKRAIYEVGHGMQQALDYAEMLDAPFAISSNGERFLLHDRTGITQPVERAHARGVTESLIGSSKKMYMTTLIGIFASSWTQEENYVRCLGQESHESWTV